MKAAREKDETEAELDNLAKEPYAWQTAVRHDIEARGERALADARPADKKSRKGAKSFKHAKLDEQLAETVAP